MCYIMMYIVKSTNEISKLEDEILAIFLSHNNDITMELTVKQKLAVNKVPFTETMCIVTKDRGLYDEAACL